MLRGNFGFDTAYQIGGLLLMQKNDLLRMDDSIYRVLDSVEDMTLLIDCIKRTMPKWCLSSELLHSKSCTESELLTETNIILRDMESLSADSKRFIHEHYSLIVGILPYVGDKQTRSRMIAKVAAQKNISKRTVSNYLLLFLAFQNMSIFAPKEQEREKELTQAEKNMRWALNKFYYTKNKNSLKAAYTFMLKEKYCDGNGVLIDGYPSFNQFRYFFEKHNKLQTQYISRNGLKHYQRNQRPLLGDGQNTFAPYVGTGLSLRFFALDEWKLGCIRDHTMAQLLGSSNAKEFNPPTGCFTCPYKALCRTGCFRDWEETDTGFHNHYCESFKMLFAYALPRLLEVANAEIRSRQNGGSKRFPGYQAAPPAAIRGKRNQTSPAHMGRGGLAAAVEGDG